MSNRVDEYLREFDDEDEDDETVEATTPKVETADEKVARLETEVKQGRAAIAEKFSSDALAALQAKSTELADLNKRLTREKALKETYRRRYANSTFVTPAEFDHLWETKLRDEAIAEDVARSAPRKPKKHSLYKW